MEVICLDLEGVLVPEIWIAVARETRIDELKLTTRDISDYDELMNHRLGILNREGITLKHIQDVIATLEPFDQALEFIDQVRSETQLVILSDTFEQFASPFMRKLNWPTLFCNTLIADSSERILGYRLRQKDGKRKAVESFKAMGLRVFAAGDSFNDVTMLLAAHSGMFFRAPQAIREQYPQLPAARFYGELIEKIRKFVRKDPHDKAPA